MKFLLSDELESFSHVLRDFFRTKVTAEYLNTRLVRRLNEELSPEFDQELWQSSLELGLLLAPLPAEQGGLGLLGASLCIEEASRVLLPAPVFETICHAMYPLLCFCPENELLGDITAGKILVTGTLESGCSYSKGKLTANIEFVPGVNWAEKILIVSAENGLFFVENQEASPQHCFDLLRLYGQLELKSVEAERLVSGPLDIERFSMISAVLTASELVGVASASLELSLDYVKTRNQFGRPVGSFQAVQHTLADISLRVEQATALVRFAAWCADSDPEQFPEASAAAKAFASDVVPEAIESCIQMHGGIGFTYEYCLHLYLRRAKTLSQLQGDPSTLYASLA